MAIFVFLSRILRHPFLLCKLRCLDRHFPDSLDYFFVRLEARQRWPRNPNFETNARLAQILKRLTIFDSARERLAAELSQRRSARRRSGARTAGSHSATVTVTRLGLELEGLPRSESVSDTIVLIVKSRLFHVNADRGRRRPAGYQLTGSLCFEFASLPGLPFGSH